eukprot:3935496-Rhodomonas_salina.4
MSITLTKPRSCHRLGSRPGHDETALEVQQCESGYAKVRLDKDSESKSSAQAWASEPKTQRCLKLQNTIGSLRNRLCLG